MRRYKLVTVDGGVSYQKKMSLRQMQDFVGGWIEMVGDVICNEYGKIVGLRTNALYPRFVGNIIVREEERLGKIPIRRRKCKKTLN